MRRGIVVVVVGLDVLKEWRRIALSSIVRHWVWFVRDEA